MIGGSTIKKLTKALSLSLLVLALPLLTSCEEDALSTTVATTASTTTAVTTIDRDKLSTPEELTDLQIKAMQAIWSAVKNDVRDEYTINDVTIGNPVYECDEAIICFFYGFPLPSAVGDALTEETVSGCQFRYTSTLQLSVFANQTKYTLQGALNAGVLTEDEIRTIWEEYKADNAALYESDQ